MPTYEPEYELSDMLFDEVSLVPSGDDSMARMVLAKSDRTGKSRGGTSRSSTVVSQQAKRGTSMPKEIISKDDLPEEVVAYIDQMESALDDAFDALVTAGVIDEEGNVIGGPGDGDDGDDGDGEGEGAEAELALAKADPAVRAYIAKADKAVADANRRADEAVGIAKAEQDERVRRDFVSKAAEAFPYIGAADDVGGLLQRLHKSNPDDAAEVEELLKAANGKIEASNIFDEIGKLGANSNASDVDARATELRKADPTLTMEAARAQVYADNPKLYDESLGG